MATDLITHIRARLAIVADSITRVRVRSASQLVVSPGPPRTVEPYDVVNLSATASSQPAEWIWEQVDGEPVTLTGSGSQRSYTAPPTIDGTILVFQITAVPSFGSPATAQVPHVVYPHTIWRGSASGPVPVRIFF